MDESRIEIRLVMLKMIVMYEIDYYEIDCDVL